MISSTQNRTAPLYIQARDFIMKKIAENQWKPGTSIPAEMQLADELNMSQGTVRKAITDLVQNNVLVRHQGKGTFVASHDSDRDLFHFFHIENQAGEKALPDSKTLSCRRGQATKTEAASLQLNAREPVIRIERIRTFEGEAAIFEEIVLPAHRFQSLDRAHANRLPNALYQEYEDRFGITIQHAEEKLTAVSASDKVADLLNLSPRSPLLRIERLARTIDAVAVELRISLCNTQHHCYKATLY